MISSRSAHQGIESVIRTNSEGAEVSSNIPIIFYFEIRIGFEEKLYCSVTCSWSIYDIQRGTQTAAE